MRLADSVDAKLRYARQEQAPAVKSQFSVSVAPPFLCDISLTDEIQVLGPSMTLTVVGGRPGNTTVPVRVPCCFCAPLWSTQRRRPTILRSQLKGLSEEPIVRGQNAYPSSGGDPNLFWRHGIFVTIVQLEKPIATLSLADKPPGPVSQLCQSHARGCGCEIVSKAIVPGYRWFAQQARVFMVTALSGSSECGSILEWAPSFVKGGVWF